MVNIAWPWKLAKYTRRKISSNTPNTPTSILSFPENDNSDATNNSTDPNTKAKAVSFHLNSGSNIDDDDDDSYMTLEFDPYREAEEQPLLECNTPVRSNKNIRTTKNYESTYYDHRYPREEGGEDEVDAELNTHFMHFTKRRKQKRERKRRQKQQAKYQQEEQPRFRRKIRHHRSGKEIWASLSAKVLDGTFMTQLSSSSYPLSSSIKTVLPSPLRDQQEQEQEQEQEQQPRPPNSNHTLIECALFLILYLLIGILAYSILLDSWPIVDSLYFTVVTLTTVGYGDVAPMTWQGRLFTCFFALTGVAILGMVLGEVGMRMVEAEVKAVDLARETAAQRILEVWRKGPVLKRSSSLSKGEEGSVKGGDSIREMIPTKDFRDDIKYVDDESSSMMESSSTLSSSARSIISSSSSTICSSRQHLRQQQRQKIKRAKKQLRYQKQRITSTAFYAWSEMCRVFGRYVPAMVPLVVGALFMAHSEDWSYLDAIYYCIVTTTTIGFGDLTPTLPRTKWFAVLFIPLSVGAMGHILGTVANDILERRRELYQDFLLQQDQLRPLTINDLHIMNDKGEGNVSELEYVTFMLVRMGRVEWETVDELRERFRSWDVRGDGMVCKDDLELVARRKRRGVRGKLGLEEYKRRLIDKCSSSSSGSAGDIDGVGTVDRICNDEVEK